MASAAWPSECAKPIGGDARQSQCAAPRWRRACPRRQATGRSVHEGEAAARVSGVSSESPKAAGRGVVRGEAARNALFARKRWRIALDSSQRSFQARTVDVAEKASSDIVITGVLVRGRAPRLGSRRAPISSTDRRLAWFRRDPCSHGHRARCCLPTSPRAPDRCLLLAEQRGLQSGPFWLSAARYAP